MTFQASLSQRNMQGQQFLRVTLLTVLLSLVNTFPSTLKCPSLQISQNDLYCQCDQPEDPSDWKFTCLSATSNNDKTSEINFNSKRNRLDFTCSRHVPYEQPIIMKQLNTSQIHDYSFRFCPLQNTTLEDVLPGSLMETLKIEKLPRNESFHDNFFHGMTSLIRLSLTRNEIQDLPASVFDSLSNLKFLDLSDNNLTSLEENIFWKLTNLVTLDISSNELENLPENIFQGLYQLQTLYLYKNKLQKIPNGLFHNLNVLKVLDLRDNHLILLPDSLFDGLTELIYANFRANWLQIVPSTLFNSTKNLRKIDIGLNRFMQPLPKELLSELAALENISIDNCNLTVIDERFFSSNQNLTHLQLDYNKLSILPEQIFKNNFLLKEINLNFNRITELPLNIFPKQNHLESLLFFSNSLTFLPPGVFANAKNLKVLNLGRNHIVNATSDIFADLPNLEKLDLSINNISQFSLAFNPELKRINLSYNNLTRMPDINWIQYLKLEDFNLDYNKISFLSIPTVSSTNARNPSLSFSHNNIKIVDVTHIKLNDQEIKNLPSGQYEKYVETDIALYPNPFLCDCRMYSFYDYLLNVKEPRKRSVNFSRFRNFTCHQPGALSGREIISLEPEQFVCEITKDCPHHCECYYRAYKNTMVVNCSKHPMKSPPRRVPFNTSILYFQDNNFSHMEKFNSRIWENLTELYLDKNMITSLEKWHIPPKLRKLSLRRNHIKYISENFMNHASNIEVFLSDNPWSCNCTTMSFKKWLTEHYEKVKDINRVYCGTKIKQDDTYVKVSVITIPDEVMCPLDDWPYKAQLISVTIVCVMLALLLFVVSVLYYRNKQTVIAYVYIHFHQVFACFFNERDMDEDKIFDAFVAYSSTDRDVALMLIEELETKEPHFRLCIHERNWLPGNLISWNIINSVQNSRRTILVVSKDFLESMWFHVEFHTAYYQMLEDKIDRLIMIVKGELPPKDTLDKDLQYLMSTKTYLVWEEKWFWEKLKYAMPHKKQIISSDVMALKDRPDSEKVKQVENQIAILSANKSEKVQNGNHILTVANKNNSNNNKPLPEVHCGDVPVVNSNS